MLSVHIDVCKVPIADIVDWWRDALFDSAVSVCYARSTAR